MQSKTNTEIPNTKNYFLDNRAYSNGNIIILVFIILLKLGHNNEKTIKRKNCKTFYNLFKEILKIISFLIKVIQKIKNQVFYEKKVFTKLK